MNQEQALLVMIAVAALLIAVGVFAWIRRTRRDRTPLIAPSELPADAIVTGRFDGFYVATTVRDMPLERIAAPGLSFRSRASLTVTDRGVALDVTGQPRIVLSADRLVAIAQATVAIDRVVEKDGLAKITWTTDAGTVVDTYFRSQTSSARSVADAIRPLVALTDDLDTTPTGIDA